MMMMLPGTTGRWQVDERGQHLLLLLVRHLSEHILADALMMGWKDECTGRKWTRDGKGR